MSCADMAGGCVCVEGAASAKALRQDQGRRFRKQKLGHCGRSRKREGSMVGGQVQAESRARPRCLKVIRRGWASVKRSGELLQGCEERILF